ncbi:MAG: LutC/YkgG family protein [Thermodesulfobacteriota bacterium]
MSDRELILSRIRGALNKASRPPSTPPVYEGFTSPLAPATKEMVRMFRKEAEAQDVKVHEASGPPEAGRTLGIILKGLRAKTVFAWSDAVMEHAGIPAALDGLGIRNLTPASGHQGEAPGRAALGNSAALADAGITGADFGLADTGSLVLLSSPKKSRSASLLPPVHIALLPASRILPHLPALLNELPQDPRAALDRGSAVTLITGTSKTADIELTLVRGVHGPGEVHVIIYHSELSDDPERPA